MLTPDQQEAFESTQTKKIVYVTGPAGTGKSYLIHHIQSECEKQNIPVITLSSTGISAHHIQGMTVHGFLCRLRLKLIQPTIDTVFIVDEISMLGRKVFDQFESSLRKYFSVDWFDPKDRSNPFGGAKIILFGDFAQLPPIHDEYCFFSESWDCIQAHHELTTIKRQNDPEFKTFLSHIRTGKIIQDDKDKLQSMTKRKPTPTSTFLFLSNQEAEEFNYKNLSTLTESSDSHTFPSVISSNGFGKEEIRSFFQERHQCYETLTVCVGAKCMLTANLDVSNGWCNGTLGTIHEIQEDRLIMKNKHGAILPIPRKSYQRKKYRQECDVILRDGKKRVCGSMTCEHTPVYFYTDDEENQKEPISVLEVNQFPILLAWGITIHKSQGMTLDECTITLPYQYSPSLIYVALSRCVTFEKICLQSEHPIKYDQIRPSNEVMEYIFHWKKKICKLCKEEYMGPYASFCGDCCSAPGKYSMYRFIDFIPEANPSPDMIQYMNYVLCNPSKGSTEKWKKFIAFCKTI
jgi:ATP-dependent DNA helicase PIF1